MQRAAIRIANYWNRRIELFGDNLAFKEIKLGDSGIYSKNTETNSDNESEHNEKDATIIKSTILGLSHGILRPTTTHDTGGRAIVFIDPSRLKNYNKHNEMERMGVARTFWCVLHSILENNDTAQKVGIVVLAYPHHLKLSYVDRKLMRMNMESLSGCIPVRLGALHVCHPPWFFAKIVFPIMKLVAGDRIRKRVRLHSGTEEKVLQDLEGFGLGKEVLPSELGGEVVLEE